MKNLFAAQFLYYDTYIMQLLNQSFVLHITEITIGFERALLIKL